jgi:hypothetical protein
MQVFGNLGTSPLRVVSKASGKAYWQFRLAESQKSDGPSMPLYYTVRCMVDKDPCLNVGDFVRVTGKLKVDFYLNKLGEPSGNLLVIAFEATKYIRPDAVIAEAEAKKVEKVKVAAPSTPKVTLATAAPTPKHKAVATGPMHTTVAAAPSPVLQEPLAPIIWPQINSMQEPGFAGWSDC